MERSRQLEPCRVINEIKQLVGYTDAGRAQLAYLWLGRGTYLRDRAGIFEVYIRPRRATIDQYSMEDMVDNKWKHVLSIFCKILKFPRIPFYIWDSRSWFFLTNSDSWWDHSPWLCWTVIVNFQFFLNWVRWLQFSNWEFFFLIDHSLCIYLSFPIASMNGVVRDGCDLSGWNYHGYLRL